MSETQQQTRPGTPPDVRPGRWEALGLRRLLHDLRHRPERFRQFIGVAFALVVTVLAAPVRQWFVAGIVLVVLGMLVRLWASGHVIKDKALATTGPYAFVRHPLYVGNEFIGVGFCLACGLWWSLPVWILISLLFYPPAIRQEDAKLHHLFGETWERWRARTRALIPRLTPYGSGVGGEWSFRQSIRNGEPVYVVLFCLMLYYLYIRADLG
jgi:protein-S-isoprenylcysteine O-methyltransferase Ste14